MRFPGLGILDRLNVRTLRIIPIILLVTLLAAAQAVNAHAANLSRYPAGFVPIAVHEQQLAEAHPATAVATPLLDPAQPAQIPTYIDPKICTSCHVSITHGFSQTMMGKLFLNHPRNDAEKHACQTCHGPGSIYAEAMEKAMGAGAKPDEIVHGIVHEPGLITFRKDSGETAAQDNQVCLNCHENGQLTFWRASTHAFRGLRCVDCHEIMVKESPQYALAARLRSNPFIISRPETEVCLKCHLRQAMEINLPAHMPLREGLMTCTSCHNPHGGPYPHMLREATVNETCYFCHAEKRGPFLWVHPPVMQNCLNCHVPHGSVNRFMLKAPPPRLCQQCHIGTFHPGSPGAIGSVFVFSRACLSCHSHIHGSNSPGGRVFTR